MEWGKFAPYIITSASSLIGVILGATLTLLRDIYKDYMDRKRDLCLLAVLVSAHLEHYFEACYYIAIIDGKEDGGFVPNYDLDLPKFSYLDLNVNWSVLEPRLLHEIVAISINEKSIFHSLEINKHESPEFFTAEDYCQLRQTSYRDHCLKIHKTLTHLQKHTQIPGEEFVDRCRDKVDDLSKIK